MISLKIIMVSLFGLYLVGLTGIMYHYGPHKARELPSVNHELKFLQMSNSNSFIPTKKSFEFHDKYLALEILRQVDIYKPVNDTFYRELARNKNKFGEPFLGMIPDNDYCDKHRAAFVENPQVFFDNINLILTSGTKHLIRSKAIPSIAKDIHPEIGDSMPIAKRDSFSYDISPEANFFWMVTSLYKYRHIGKQYACTTQASNQVPGSEAMSRKDTVAESANAFAKKFANRPQCFSRDKFFPETWLLYDKKDCKAFFKIFNSEEYQKLKAERRIVYIRKIGAGSHRAEGVEPVTEQEEAHLRHLYANGEKCGEIKLNYIIQHYINNPLLLDGHKFDFRMYMLVASTNPVMAYYHDGFLRVTLADYDINSDEKKVLLTNLALNKQIYEDVEGGRLYNGMNEEELKQAQQWSMERLQEHLLKRGKITDPNWLDNYLRPEFKKAMIHLVRMSAHTFLENSAVYELYGVDFMLDEDLNLWFIELNSGPAIGGYSVPMEKFIVKMVQDHFEVVNGLLKSRMKRIVTYINKLIDERQAYLDEEGQVVVPAAAKVVFREISKNHFEIEYEPSASNGFSLIVDRNHDNFYQYMNIIDKNCFS